MPFVADDFRVQTGSMGLEDGNTRCVLALDMGHGKLVVWRGRVVTGEPCVVVRTRGGHFSTVRGSYGFPMGGVRGR